MAGRESTDPPSMAQRGPDEQTEENDGLEGNVGGEKVGDRGSDPDAQRERNEEEGQQRQGLPRAALLGEEQAAKGAGARQHAGHGGDYAQLYQQRDENEPVGHFITVSRCGGTAQTQTDGSSAACELACA